MAVKIILTPELLKSQSSEMTQLMGEYESLFAGVTSTLNQTNSNWSENLSRNFAGKISSAQKNFAGIVEMLNKGASAAMNSAVTMESVDQSLSKAIGNAAADVAAAVTSAAVGSSGGRAPVDSDVNSHESLKNKSTLDKVKDLEAYYINKADEYRKKAENARKNWNYLDAARYEAKALEASATARGYKSINGYVAAADFLGWDDQKTYESFGKAMENTPGWKDILKVEQGFQQVFSGDIYEGIDEIGSNLPVVKYGWNFGKGMGQILTGDRYGALESLLKSTPATKKVYDIGKGTVEIATGNVYDGIDDIAKSLPKIGDGWKIGKATGGWTEYLINWTSGKTR